MQKVRFANANIKFQQTLKKRVDAYFSETNQRQSGNFKLYFKTTTILLVFFSIYLLLMLFPAMPTWLQIVLVIIWGVDLAAIGFNIMHDGAHGSYSQNTVINNIMSHTLNVLGGYVDFWKQKHNVNHHTFTNIEGHDDDIDIKPFIRTHQGQRFFWFHKYQHIYGWFLYCTTYLFWIYRQDFKKYFSGKIADNTKIKPFQFKDHLVFWGSKVFHVFLFIVVPIFVHGFVSTIIGYLIMASVTGFVIAIVFQLAHLVEDIQLQTPDSDSQMHLVENDWAIHQIATTVNFGTGSKVLSWLLGGLNFQVEHHLFPKISHIHYPAINKIVKDTCNEFQVGYREFPTMWKALVSHYKHLEYVGNLR